MSEHMPVSEPESRKPILFHDLRVGVYLYEQGYSEEIVVGGLLHDMLEWSRANQDLIRDVFGEKILTLVQANSKDDSIEDSVEKTNELISRCVQCGQDALIIKSADIIDSFKWYTLQNNEKELQYCIRNADTILKLKLDTFQDKIFDEIRAWRDKFS